MSLARSRRVPKSHQWRHCDGLVMTSNPPWLPFRCAQCGEEHHFLAPGPNVNPRPYLDEIGPCNGPAAADPQEADK